eukprot:c52162_g1_i1.p1 GENE.c52162_g1_i1~~c52162_g1_i1.p1  ORF type:complete len:270 (-),score=25.40 c52162_g1_i1:42-812(-)
MLLVLLVATCTATSPSQETGKLLQPDPQQLLQNLLTAVSQVSQSAPLRGVPSSYSDITAQEIRPVPPNLSQDEKQQLLKRAQLAMDRQHVMPETMFATVQKYSSHVFGSGPALTPQEQEMISTFLSDVNMPGFGSQSLIGAVGSTKPLAPSRPLLVGITNLLWLIQAILLMPLLQIPALVQMFIEPTMMVPQPQRQPAPARPRTKDDKIFHPYGQYGDYGYEHRGYKGYGCASGRCAPWWWTWRKKSPYYPFVGRD